MRYAEVAVDAPLGPGRTLSYSIPPWMDLEPGHLAWVPLGPRPVQGVVVRLTPQPQVEDTREVIASVDPSPLVTAEGLALAQWISAHYMAPLFVSASLLLPPGFESRVRCILSSGRKVQGLLTSGESTALEYLDGHGEARDGDVAKALGRGGEGIIRGLLRRGLLQRRWEMLRPRIAHRYQCYLRPSSPDPPGPIPQGVLAKAPRQRALYEALLGSTLPVPMATASKEYGPAAVAGLLSRGFLAQEWVRVAREPALQRAGPPAAQGGPALTAAQKAALAPVLQALEGTTTGERPFLLHGVTGSGKTEVYLRALERCLELGKRGILLVPEIALTPQMVHHLSSRFPGKVAILHSGLSQGERFDQWWRIKGGDFDVVVGPRSALFAPLPDLGLIVVDEEHEWTYKQEESPPHYHARDVALKLADLSGAVVLMGSATPSVETYHKAVEGQVRLLELPRRVAQAPDALGAALSPEMPRVELCDMRRELREGNRSIFGRALANSLEECVRRGQQAILFLNRRGSSTVVQCRDCGAALRCRSCSVPLTYHGAQERLLCHYCNRRSRIPGKCPQCRGGRIRYLGLGTQRVMEELRALLPGVRALRWDRDTARRPQAHETLMGQFLRGDAEVLVGTQMVAKGLHFPRVTLVGAILADLGLNLPDFRASERTFQLLCQVVGRAGRGGPAGRAIIQTYNPDSYAIQAAGSQDYGSFYAKEVRYRGDHSNPPFNDLAHLVYIHADPGACQREAQKVGTALRQRAYARGLAGLEVVGPAPGFPERVRGRYRWHMVLRGRDLQSFLEGVTFPEGWSLDIDPMSVL